jgi:hypothetical protein
MTDRVLRASPEVLRRHAGRGLRHEARLIERFIRLLTGGNSRRCEISGAGDAETRNEH